MAVAAVARPGPGVVLLRRLGLPLVVAAALVVLWDVVVRVFANVAVPGASQLALSQLFNSQALLGLFCLYWVGSNFLVWLLLLMVGTWLSSQIQSGSTGIGYVGTQAEIAFLLSMIQGQGPPLSPTPGLDRFAGIMAGLSVLLIITMVISLFRLAPLPTSTAHGD